MKNVFNLGIILTAILWSLNLNSQVVVNEFSIANYTDFEVGGGGWGGGDYEDWIEFYNPTGAAVDIGGFYLSDDPLNVTKFEIPPGTDVPANGHLLVLFSALWDEDPYAYGWLNTSFKITQTKGESVIFADAGGAVIEQFTFDVDIEPNHANHSYGRSSDGAADWVIFTNASPEDPNGGASGTSYTPDPEMDIEAGYYGAAVDVVLSCGDATADIYYTLNGDSPTTADALYTGPINISTTSTLRAIAYSGSADALPSHVMSNTYFFGADQHTVPVVNISGNTLNDGAWAGDELCHIEFFHPGGEFWCEAYGDSNEHGNDSNAYDQRGFDYVTRDQLGQNFAVEGELFHHRDRDDFERVIFKAAANDNYTFSGGAHVRDSYCHEITILADMKMDQRATEYCVVYINGAYWGVYDYREKVDDIDYTFEYYDQPRHFVDYLKTWGGTWEEYGSGDDWYDLVDFITANDMTDPANYDYVKSVYNTNSLIDYFILNSYVVATDWLNWNTSWWRGRHPDGSAKKWRYSLWDMDATFGHYINYTGVPDVSPEADPCNPEGMGDVGGQGHIPILNALMDNEDFYADYINRWAAMSNTHFSCASMNALLDSMTGVIAPEMQRQVDRWGGTYAGWEDAIQEMRDFMDERCSDEFVSGLEDCYDVTAINVTVNIVGIGEVDVASAIINQNMTPWTGFYWEGVEIDVSASTGLGVFAYWEVNEGDLVIDDINNPEFVFSPTGDVTITAYFDNNLDPQPIVFDVVPAGAGDILVNGNNMGPYPGTQMVNGGGNTMSAVPATLWFEFDHWETVETNVNPDDTEADVSIFVLQPDTIVAVFNELENYTVSIDVMPAGAGTIEVEMIPIDVPYNGQMAGGVDLNFITYPSDEWSIFSHWEINNHVITPDEFSANMFVNLNQSDEIVAVYDVLDHYTITVIVDPPLAGSVDIESTLVVNSEWTGELEGEVLTNFTAYAQPYWLFKNWEPLNAEALPNEYDELVQFKFSESDTIIAHFEQEPFTYYIPNSFTPNNDGKNDVFLPIGNAYEVTSYQIEIYNRWGEVVFASMNPNEAWDGSHQLGDYYIEDETYVYRMKVKSIHDLEEKEFSGHIMVFR